MDKPRVVHKGYGNGSCVALVQAMGFDIHAGAARNWPTAAKKLGYLVDTTPEAGAVIVTKESSRGSTSGHVALVQGILATGLLIREQNYVGKGIVSTRLIAFDSATYKSAVFIHPFTQSEKGA